MATYRDFLQKNAPPWLQGDNAQALLGALGDYLDGAKTRVRQAIKARFPGLAAEAGDDYALSQMGAERQIDRGPQDTLTAAGRARYAAKIEGAWETWARAGSPLSLLLALEEAGYDSTAGNPVVIQQLRYAFTLDPDTSLEPENRLVQTELGGNPEIFGYMPLYADAVGWWVFDDSLDEEENQFNGRFAVLFQDPLPATWTNIVEPPTTGTAPTLAEINGIIQIIHKWKPASRICVKIVIIPDSALVWGWPASQTWGGTGLVWGGDGGESTDFDCEEY